MNHSAEHATPKGSFPTQFTTYEALVQHIRGQLDGLSTTQKGEKFAHLVQMLVPQTDIGTDFELPKLNERKSGDEGVDLDAKGKDGQSILYVQAKLWIDRAEAIDGILSKFQSYLTMRQTDVLGQQRLFDLEQDIPHFLVVTLSPLENILTQYKKKQFSSKEFFQQCASEHRLHFVDGYQILSVLQAAYRKIHEVPTNLVLTLETQPIQASNVYFGVVSSAELQKVHRQFGDALFFENIRDFQGPAKSQKKEGRATVNDEIIKTITESPERMLERNNGIVFRAERVDLGDSPNQLVLASGSVVNGCQTTMCLVEYAQQTCLVPVKIVQTSNSWDVAKAANHQNPVDVIDLDLARSLRPQLAKRAATVAGIRINEGKESAFQIIDAIYEHKVTYNETRILYIGLFSRTPNNVFANNYTELLPELIGAFYREDPYGEQTYETIFLLQEVTQEALKAAQVTFSNPAYAGTFERLYSEDSLSYRCFIGILALCGALNTNIFERKGDVASEYERMKTFLTQAHAMLTNRKARFVRYFKHSVKIWMQETAHESEEAATRQNLAMRTKRLNFANMFRKLAMEADMDDWLREEEQRFSQGNGEPLAR